jgi:hypothetical protein
MILIDSDIVIWILRGDTQMSEMFKRATVDTDGNLFVTPVQIAEVFAGVLPKERMMVENFFSSLGVIAINDEIGKLAGEFMNLYKKSHSLTLADALVAAAAKLNGCKLWTKNKKHYPMIAKNELFSASFPPL